jgi:hypothetical protein
MFQVVNERYLHRRPMLFTTDKALAAWGLVLHDPDLAEAILDRVLERGRLVELRGASYRTRHLKAVDHRGSLTEVVRISGNQRSDFPERTRRLSRHPARAGVLGESRASFSRRVLDLWLSGRKVTRIPRGCTAAARCAEGDQAHLGGRK